MMNFCSMSVGSVHVPEKSKRLHNLKLSARIPTKHNAIKILKWQTYEKKEGKSLKRTLFASNRAHAH